LLSIGRPDEAEQQVARIVEDDPLCQMWYYTMAISLAALGREDDALGAIRRAVELDPQFWLGWTLQGLLHAVHGRDAESLQCAEKGIAGAPWAPVANGVMAAALTNADRANDAEPLLNVLRSNPSVGSIGMTYYYLARGDIERVIEWAGTAADQRVASLVTILVRPFEPRLRTSPEWPALLKRLNLAPTSTAATARL
jgi:tetratricopeptide (TPR) repeat protein